jgi:hypothetical protein
VFDSSGELFNSNTGAAAAGVAAAKHQAVLQRLIGRALAAGRVTHVPLQVVLDAAARVGQSGEGELRAVQSSAGADGQPQLAGGLAHPPVVGGRIPLLFGGLDEGAEELVEVGEERGRVTPEGDDGGGGGRRGRLLRRRRRGLRRCW